MFPEIHAAYWFLLNFLFSYFKMKVFKNYFSATQCAEEVLNKSTAGPGWREGTSKGMVDQGKLVEFLLTQFEN